MADDGDFVVGPTTSVVNAAVTWDDETGTKVKSSTVKIDPPTGDIETTGDVNASGLTMSNEGKTLAMSQSPSQSVDELIFVLPPDHGASGQVLTTDGSGVTSWSAGGSGGDITGPDTTTLQGIPTWGDELGKTLLNNTKVTIDKNGSVITRNIFSSYAGSIRLGIPGSDLGLWYDSQGGEGFRQDIYFPITRPGAGMVLAALDATDPIELVWQEVIHGPDRKISPNSIVVWSDDDPYPYSLTDSAVTITQSGEMGDENTLVIIGNATTQGNLTLNTNDSKGNTVGVTFSAPDAMTTGSYAVNLPNAAPPTYGVLTATSVANILQWTNNVAVSQLSLLSPDKNQQLNLEWPVGGTTYILQLPSAAPTAIGQTLITNSTATPFSLQWGTPTQVDMYDIPGTYTWTKNPAANFVQIMMMGGGGGGANPPDTYTGVAEDFAGGNGGGGGCYVQSPVMHVDWFSSTEVVIAGVGGSGGHGFSEHDGHDGGNSSFGNWFVATGGQGGKYNGTPGTSVAGYPNISSYAGGVGGIASATSPTLPGDSLGYGGAGGGYGGSGGQIQPSAGGGINALGLGSNFNVTFGSAGVNSHSGARAVAGGYGVGNPMGFLTGGPGGGGGGSGGSLDLAGIAGKGGNGGLYGGGGGGAGSWGGPQESSSGGGDGARGYVLILQW